MSPRKDTGTLEVEAMLIENPICDFVLGNAPDVSKFPDEMWGKNWVKILQQS